MRPAVNSDESVTPDRSVHVKPHTDHPSRRRKEQISGSKNAQAEYGAHLSQNDAHSSTYGSTTPLDRHNANRANTVTKDHRDVPRSSEKTEQRHKGVDKQDVDSPRRYQSPIADEESDTAESSLWCPSCRKKKKKPKLDVRKPTRRLLERIKKRDKKCERRTDDEAVVADVSIAPHRETMSHRDDSRKFQPSRKQDATTVDAADTVEKAKEDRKEKKRREKERQKRKERKERERKEERERHKREERIPRPVDTLLMTLDEDLVAEDRVHERLPPPPSPLAPMDITKTCCYLCAQNTLAIAAATAVKPEQFDKYIQVPAHKFRTERPRLDRSCSPMLLVRTVQSSVKVKTREISTLCPGTSAQRKETQTKTKRKKFSVFPRLMRTKCPAGPNAVCEIDKAARRDNAEKRGPRSEKCCREKNA